MQAKMIPYLEFENAKEALAYYQGVFGATNVYRVSPTADEAEQYGLEPDVDLDQLTMIGGFQILGLDVQCADALMGRPTSSTLISLMIQVDEDDSEAVKALTGLYQRLVKSDVKVISPFTTQRQGGQDGADRRRLRNYLDLARRGQSGHGDCYPRLIKIISVSGVRH